MKSTSQPHAQGDGLQGEGNYDAARRHRESAEKFAHSGKVEPAAREAAPRNPAEEREMREAEDTGKSHAKR